MYEGNKNSNSFTNSQKSCFNSGTCRFAQQDSFSDDLLAMTSGKEIPRNSKLKWLSPFIDELGILRVGGRLRNAQIAESTKHPILLFDKHPLAALLAVAYHQKYMHTGPEHLWSILRQRFWTIGGRNLTKAVFHRCHKCFKVKPTLVTQTVADLPTPRVSPTSSFAVSGVDYCGPVWLKSTVHNRSPTKAYIAIFVCFATRAIHIDLTFRRFVARRGKIAELHSDNATTFKGAVNELHRIYEMFKYSNQERIEIFSWCANEEIQWRLIPPRAPHFGGLWEAAVRSAKQHLIRTIESTSLTQEGMITLLAQVEQCLNSRPLIPLSSEPSNTQPQCWRYHRLIGVRCHPIG
uniref:Integrase_H2C2 domain-containing protein n=1 Tax=Anopheles christyi TaxID=43041 RepID=A0A182K662_9DIPT